MTSAGEVYHIRNQKTDTRPLFKTTAQYQAFTKQLGQSLGAQGCTLLAFVLMPDHYHLLVLENEDEALPKAIYALERSYTQTLFGKKAGGRLLFRESFQMALLPGNAQLAPLTRYLHRHPQAAGLVTDATDWPHSSLDYYTGSAWGRLVRPDLVLSDFPDKSAYWAYVEAKAPEPLSANLILE